MLYKVIKINFIFKQSKIALLCISIETLKVAFFVKKVEILQVLGVKVSTGGSTELNVRSFEALVTIYLSITIVNYTKYLIIKLSPLKKSLKKQNNEIITQYLTGSTVV
jgi:hypothetical protein